MTQEQYNLICKVLQNGAPALAVELINAVNEMVQENIDLKHNKAENCEKQEEDK